eukprot:Clim_evm50s207 gene=Clim_evmTU50s207
MEEDDECLCMAYDNLSNRNAVAGKKLSILVMDAETNKPIIQLREGFAGKEKQKVVFHEHANGKEMPCMMDASQFSKHSDQFAGGGGGNENELHIWDVQPIEVYTIDFHPSEPLLAVGDCAGALWMVRFEESDVLQGIPSAVSSGVRISSHE